MTASLCTPMSPLKFTYDLPQYALRPECVEKYLKLSLANLQLDYVDLYLIHNSVGCMEISKEITDPFILDPETDHVKIWKALEAQVDAGRAKSIGLSNFNARQIKRVWQSARIKPVMHQIELHVFFEQREIVAFCKALDIEVTAYAPLGCPDIGSVGWPKGFMCPRPDLKLKMTYPLEDPLVKKIAKKHNRTPAQILLRHTIQRDIIVIPKSSDPTRIRENFNVFNFELSQEEVDELRTLDRFKEGRLFEIAIFPGYQNLATLKDLILSGHSKTHTKVSGFIIKINKE
ncbi:unnamed protein product, partial [Timema podura]|nr:unnamed protein product [Timema podura]